MSDDLEALLTAGDHRRAAGLLVRRHAPAVFALCRAMVRDPQLAEDLSQDTFARALAAIDGYRGEASPRTWLLKIARNRCLDHLARARRAPWGRDPDPEPDEHPAVDEPAPIDLLRRREDAEQAMAVLGEAERALVVLHFGHGVGYPELADSFGIGQGAVRMRVSRALARMRDALAARDREADAWLDEATHEEARVERVSVGAPRAEDFAEDDLELGADDALAYDFDDQPTRTREPAEATFAALVDEVPPSLWRALEALTAR